MFPKFNLLYPLAGQDDDSDQSTIDPEEDKAHDEATKQRKRAGLPQITVDTLPSSVSNKMMKLDLNTYQIFIFQPQPGRRFCFLVDL